MSAAVLTELVRGALFLLWTVLIPGILLERSLARSRTRAEAVFLVPVLGTVTVATLAASLAFLTDTYVSGMLLMLAAAAIIAVTAWYIPASSGRATAGSGSLGYDDVVHGATLLVALLIVVGVHWSLYDASYSMLHSRCSFQGERYLLGLPQRCRVNGDVIAELPPPRSLPGDIVTTCPGEDECPFIRSVIPGLMQERMDRGDEPFRIAYFLNAHLGYPVLMAPYARALRYFGFHVFFLLTRALCMLGTYTLLRRFSDSHWSSLLVSAIIVLNPVVSYAITHNENLAGLFLSVTAVLLVLDEGPWAGRRAFASGLVLGALLGVRHITVVSAPALVAYLIISRPSDRRATQIALLVVGATIALFPYLFWHQYVFGDILANELHFGDIAVLTEHTLPLLGRSFSTYLLLNWPFHHTLVSAIGMPYPTFVLLGLVFLNVFGIVLSAVGLLGLLSLLTARRRASLLLLLWLVPAFSFMGLITDWDADRTTYSFLLLFIPAVWVVAGLTRLAADGDRRRDLAVVCVASILVAASLNTLAGTEFPADDRRSARPQFELDDAERARERALWTGVSLLPGGTRPFQAFFTKHRVWDPDLRLFRWDDILTFNDDRHQHFSCRIFVGEALGSAGPDRAEVVLGVDGPDGLVMNADYIWQWTTLLTLNQHCQADPPYDRDRPPPNLILLESVHGRAPEEIEERLTAVLEATGPHVPILLVLGDVSESPELASVLGGLSAVRLPTGEVLPGPFMLEGDVPSRPEGIAGRTVPGLMRGAEVVWIYGDGIPLLLRRKVGGREVWFLNALLDRRDERKATAVLNEVIARVKGPPVHLSLGRQGDVLTVDIATRSNSAVPDHVVSTLHLVPDDAGEDGLVLVLPPGTAGARVTVDGGDPRDMKLGTDALSIMSGDALVGRLSFSSNGG